VCGIEDNFLLVCTLDGSGADERVAFVWSEMCAELFE
jgi:hypothetical protein